MSIDFDKSVQTRDGREVRIYTTEGSHRARPVVGEIGGDDQAPPILCRWYGDGSNELDRQDDSDLVNVAQQYTVWVNAYQSSRASGVHFCAFRTRVEADEHVLKDRIACIQYTFTEGEGLG